MDICVAVFYRFFAFPDFRAKRSEYLAQCLRHRVKGTLLLANEGLNGALAGEESAVDQVLAYLRTDPRLAAMAVNKSFSDFVPFYRMKVKLKTEIVTLGVPGIDPTKRVGTYVPADQWNALIADPYTLVIDTRNQYEYALGTFQGASNPQTQSFREFPEYVSLRLQQESKKRIALFCTGGIRCEKATSYLLEHGLSDVYHLQGGILKYLEQIAPKQSVWRGECFVFDNRVSLDHALQKGSYDLCHGCRHPINSSDKLSAQYQPGVSCPHCFDSLSDVQKSAFAERQKQEVLAQLRRRVHIGGSGKQPKLRPRAVSRKS